MCGRYTLRHPERIPTVGEILAGIDEPPRERLLSPRYNIAPGQQVLVADRAGDGGYPLRPAEWGFRPAWFSRERRAPINARAETVADKPMFRRAFRSGRCLVPADGWYEWQAAGSGPKVPHFFHRPDDGLLWFAGLVTADGAGTPTMAILTTDANDRAKPIHGRMPVVLADEAAAAAWVDPHADADALRALLGPAPEDLVTAYPVDRHVNKPANDDPRCVEPVRDTAR